MENVAVLVDGAFFIKRALHIFGPLEPNDLADKLWKYAEKHTHYGKSKSHKNRLYRIFFYDCPPLQNKVFDPSKPYFSAFYRNLQNRQKKQCLSVFFRCALLFTLHRFLYFYKIFVPFLCRFVFLST